MQFFEIFFKFFLFIVEVLAFISILLGGFVVVKTENWNFLGITSVIYGSFIFLSFEMQHCCMENSIKKTKKVAFLIILDLFMIFCLTLMIIMNIVQEEFYSKAVIDDLKNIRSIQHLQKPFVWVFLNAEKTFGCCRIFDVVSKHEIYGEKNIRLK